MFGKEEKRGVRVTKQHKDKKTRVCPYLDVDLMDKVSAMAKSTDITPAMVTLECIEYCMNHAGWVDYLQRKYGVRQDSPYRIIPTNGENGKLRYLFPGVGSVRNKGDV